MSEEKLNAGCAPSDCASCTSSCSSNPNTQQDQNMITLTLDDDTEVNCAILTIFPVGGKEYIALLPLDENGENEDGEVFLYAFTQTENGDPVLDNIDDDAEYEAAADAFDTILENARKAEEAGDPLDLSIYDEESN